MISHTWSKLLLLILMISWSKCNGGCNVLTSIISVPKETKHINVKAFNMITNGHEAKTMEKYVSCGCKCKFNTSVLLYITQIKNGILKPVNPSIKHIVYAKRL